MKHYAAMEPLVALTMDRETALSLLSMCGKVGGNSDSTYRGDVTAVYHMLREVFKVGPGQLDHRIIDRYKGSIPAGDRDDATEVDYLRSLSIPAFAPAEEPPPRAVTITLDIPTALTITSLVGSVMGSGINRERSNALWEALAPLRAGHHDTYMSRVAALRMGNRELVANSLTKEDT